MTEGLTQDQLTEELVARRPLGPGHATNHVTMVVVNRNGEEHLRRLFEALRDETDYEDFDVVVVDNASSDGSIELLTAKHWPFDVSVIRNERNETFSHANNQGIAQASGEYVLLINNDVAPANASWLTLLVETLETDASLSAVGALLIYPSRRFPSGLQPAHPDLTIQHAGVAFDWRNGLLRAYNIDPGGDPLRVDRTATRRRPGATAACVLVAKHDLEAIGGFVEGFVYGSEDWDLCLRLRAMGEIAVVGAAALFHHEYGTQAEIRPTIVDLNRRHNRNLFVDRWGPRLSRELRLDQIRHREFWTGRRGRIALVSATQADGERARGFGEALRSRGWDVAELSSLDTDSSISIEEVDFVVTTDPQIEWSRYPARSIRIGWVEDAVDWLDDEELDRVTALMISDPSQVEYVKEATGTEPMVFLPAIAPPEMTTEPDAVYEADVLVVGDRKGSGRRLLSLLDIDEEERWIIVGSGWETEPRVARYVAPEVSADELERLITNAGLVLHTASLQAAWSRGEAVLKTLALGALPVTDNFELSQWLFDGELPVVGSRNEMRTVIREFGRGSEKRAPKIERLQSLAGRHTYSRRATQFESMLESVISQPLVAFNISPHSREVAASWGDTHFARQLARSFRRLGFQTRVNILPQWDAPELQDADLIIHLRGLHAFTPKPGAVNVLWIISHPDDVTPEECNRYDIVFAASEAFARELNAKTEVPVHALLQATDPDVFHPGGVHPELSEQVLFVGNARWPPRIATRWAMEAGLPLTIYGRNWESFPENAYVAGTYFPNERLAALYESADVVLNDHWADMKRRGFLSNRLFDVLASGGLVVSDYVAGIDEAFDGAVPIYTTKDELREVVEGLLADPDERAERAMRGMQIVHRHHTFDARAKEMLEMLAALKPSIPLNVSGSATFDLAGRTVDHEQGP